jgi:hypothetical protein
MKHLLCLLCVSTLCATAALAQNAPYKVVFDLTSRDSLDQRAVLRWVKGIAESNPGAEVEVVMYAKGFELVMPDKSPFIATVKEAMKYPNVSFKACEVALRNNQVDKSALLKEVQTVPDGIYEIIAKQHQGWGYIKVVH